MTQSTVNIERALQTIAKYTQQQDVTNAAEIVGVHQKEYPQREVDYHRAEVRTYQII